MRRREQKSQQALQIECVGRATHRNSWRLVRGQAIARGVAEGAVHRYAFVAELFDRQSARQTLAFLPGQAEGAVAAVARFGRTIAGGGILLDQVREHPGQDHEDRVRDACDRLAGKRAVHEPSPVISQILVCFPEEFPPDDGAASQNNDQQYREADRQSSHGRESGHAQNVFKYSTIASLSAACSSVP